MDAFIFGLRRSLRMKILDRVPEDLNKAFELAEVFEYNKQYEERFPRRSNLDDDDICLVNAITITDESKRTCYFAVLRKQPEETLPREPHSAVTTNCGGILTSMVDLAKNVTNQFGIVNELELVLARGAGLFIDVTPQFARSNWGDNPERFWTAYLTKKDSNEEEIDDVDEIDDHGHEMSADTKEAKGLFTCQECSSSFINYGNIIRHMEIGRHRIRPEKIHIYDYALGLFKRNLEDVQAHNNVLSEVSQAMTEMSHGADLSSKAGWALRLQRKRGVYSEKAKRFAEKLFQRGDVSGRKMDPAEVERLMKEEESIKPYERMNAQQIRSYFGTLSKEKKAAKEPKAPKRRKTQDKNEEDEDEDEEMMLNEDDEEDYGDLSDEDEENIDDFERERDDVIHDIIRESFNELFNENDEPIIDDDVTIGNIDYTPEPHWWMEALRDLVKPRQVFLPDRPDLRFIDFPHITKRPKDAYPLRGAALFQQCGRYQP
ncbi:hypothetical protein PRIPAC_82840 [Pristionchus pacificus]|uniref:NAD(P)H-hydrate epimerase n=1 Tax=Pristionchus pacificus TaxID=54126 RepID=A0A2A6CK62_PRIPA|nr:hypothetical protein PRIPAC_82840 [Pristionchus pacificus]|eukprot:PDM78443.1 hypothetical protein PRIPAC_31022 [Pristionchus pacificus]